MSLDQKIMIYGSSISGGASLGLFAGGNFGAILGSLIGALVSWRVTK